MAMLRSLSRCNAALTSRQHLQWKATSSPAAFAAHLQLDDEQCGGRRALSTNNGAGRLPQLPTIVQPQQQLHRHASAAAVGAPPKDALDTSFNNAEAAFKSKTTAELLRALVVYLMCSSQYLVDNNLKVCVWMVEGAACFRLVALRVTQRTWPFAGKNR